MVGLEDASGSSSGQVLFEAFLDDRPVFARTLGAEQVVPMQLKAQNALRLKLRVTYVGPRTGDCHRDHAVWGDARLLGVPSEAPTPDSTPT